MTTPTTPAEVLRPCPFCGSANLSTDNARDFIACMDCHAEGPANFGMGSSYAADAWNRRAAIDALPSAPAVDALTIDLLQAAGYVTPEKVQQARDIAAPLSQPSAPSGEPAAPTRDDLIAALQFYAAGNHRITVDESAWDTVSGEPVQWLANEAGDMVEDGTIAAQVLAGALTAEDLADEDDDDRATTAPAPLPPRDQFDKLIAELDAADPAGMAKAREWAAAVLGAAL